MTYRVPYVGQSEIWYPPQFPHAADEEFNDGSLPSAWTRNYTPAATPIDPLAGFNATSSREDFNVRRSWFRLQPTADGTIRGVSREFPGGGAVPNGLYLARMGFEYRQGNVIDGDSSVFLRLTATTGGSNPDILGNELLIAIQEADPAGVFTVQASVYNNGVQTLVQTGSLANPSNHWEYGAILRAGNTFSCWASTSQGAWMWLANFNYVGTGGGSPAIDRIFLGTVNASTATPGNMIGKFDFFRYNSRQDLP